MNIILSFVIVIVYLYTMWISIRERRMAELYMRYTILSVEWTITHWEDIVKGERTPATDWALDKIPCGYNRAKYVMGFKPIKIEQWLTAEEIQTLHEYDKIS